MRAAASCAEGGKHSGERRRGLAREEAPPGRRQRRQTGPGQDRRARGAAFLLFHSSSQPLEIGVSDPKESRAAQRPSAWRRAPLASQPSGTERGAAPPGAARPARASRAGLAARCSGRERDTTAAQGLLDEARSGLADSPPCLLGFMDLLLYIKFGGGCFLMVHAVGCTLVFPSACF